MTGALLELYLALGALYLIECVFALRRSALVLWTWPAGEARISLAHKLPGSLTRGLFLAPPVPPFGELFQTQCWSLAFSTEGVSTLPAAQVGRDASLAPERRVVTFDEMERVEFDGVDVFVNGARLVTCASDVEAELLAGLIARLRATPAAERAAVIDEALAAAFDDARCAEELNALRPAVRRGQVIGSALFALLFAVVPYVVYRVGLVRTWPWLLAGLVLLWGAAALNAYVAHRRLYPARRAERRQGVMLSLLTPMAAIRAQDLLTRFTLARYHPLALALHLCSQEQFEELAHDVLRDLVFPKVLPLEEGDAAAQVVTAWQRTAERAACEEFLRRNAYRDGELLTPPVPHDVESRSYCPRCRCEFTHVEGACAECGVGLAAIGAAARGES